MNSVSIIGRLVKDPELKTTTNGTTVATFTIAVKRNFKNQAGEYEADFLRCVAFKKTAEVLSRYTSKGSQIGLNGRISTRNYDDKDGKKVYITEITVDTVEFLDSKQDSQPQPQSNYESNNKQIFQQDDTIDIDPDSLPF